MLRTMLLAALTAFSAPVAYPSMVPPDAGGARPATATAAPSTASAAQWGLGNLAMPSTGVPGPRPGWGWPLDPAPAVARPFHAPPTPWSAGHRGVDLVGTVGQPVLAPHDGRVSFVGMVAGRGVVVLIHADGRRTSYEPVTASVLVGALVRRGERLGLLDAAPGHCAPATCLHWGLRRGEEYLDPLLAAADPPVLKPWPDG